MVERLEGVPGVVAAGGVSFLPLDGLGAATSFRALDRPAPAPGEEPVTDVRMVSGDYFRAMGIGDLKLPPTSETTSWTGIERHAGAMPSTQFEGGHHHTGTTRMGTDPRTSVVDADCRVHGVSNLFMAGSSVFPTVGSANPTATICALAIRLADHLKERAA